MKKNIFLLAIGFLLGSFFLSAQNTETVPLKFIVKSTQVQEGQLLCQIAFKSMKDDSFKGKGTLLMSREQYNSLWKKRPKSMKGIVGYGVVTSLMAELSQTVNAERIQGRMGIVRMNSKYATHNPQAIWVDFSPEV